MFEIFAKNPLIFFDLVILAIAICAMVALGVWVVLDMQKL